MNASARTFLTMVAVFAVAVPGFQCKSQGNQEGGSCLEPAILQPEMAAASDALVKAMSDLGLKKGDPRALVLTNAGYGKAAGKTTEAFADVVPAVSGCSIGRKSLFFLHTPVTAPFWFALYRRDTSDLVFSSGPDGRFESQRIAAKSELLADHEAMRKAANGPAAEFFFQILSFADAWAKGSEWDLLKCAEFHNHKCGGVTGGYLLGKYILARFPLRDGESYVFITATPACPIDALQVMLDATAGKKKVFSTRMPDEEAAKYTVDGVRPMVIVVRVNEFLDSCEGLLLGLSRDAFSRQVASMNGHGHGFAGVKVLKKFAGDASLAAKLSETGSNPYAIVWGE